MTAIIYEGVGGGGRLFEDIKLFIMQRVPLRDTWKKLVEDNGGEVVKIDTQADYIIADHARRDCPAGSLSWKWIDQCVKDGQLVDMENYRAGPAEKSIREVGSGQPTRSGRTPFSVEDDRILMEWVTRAERQGVSTKGNELYKQLEQKNNRHTFQSWRDRWIKYLSHRPRPNHDHGDESPPPEPTFVPSRRTVSRPTAAVPSPRSPIQASSSRTTSRRLPVSVEVPSEENAHEFVAKSKGGNHFSKSERELLINTYDDIMDINDDQIINAWSVWAVKYPNHTAQEWRNYFTKKVIPRMEELRKEEEDDDNSAEPEPEEPMLPSRVDRSSASRPKPASSNRPPSNAIEIKDSQGSSGKTIDSSSARKPLPDPVLEKEELFEAKMKEVAEALNIESELDFMPSICGRHISLWSLYRVVVSDQFGGSDEVTGRYRWPEVASKLNFNAFQHKTAAEELKACYEQVLSDFEGFRVDYLQENPDLTESQEADTSQLIEDQLMQTATRESFEMDHADEDEDDDDDDLDQPPSSTPRPASPSKRGFVVDRINDRTPSKKRPRLDKGKGREIEIPSTPEEIFNGTQAARPLKPSPLKVSTVMYPDLEPEEDDNDRSSNVPSARETYRPSSSRQPPRHPEPETQDFHFPAEEPEQNNNSWISSSPPPRPQPRGLSPEESTQSQNDSKDPITAFIDYWTALAYPSELVIQALEATTMETQDAPYVMEQLTGGAGIPDDMEGVWTGEDDEALGAEGDTEEFRKVLGKHGQARVAKRMQYLREKAEVDDEDEDE